MKKFLLIIAVFIGLMATVTAQDNKGGNGKNDGSRIEALKIAYLTKKLNLSTEEAQKFWPIYNKYSEEIRAARIEAKTSNEKEINTEEKILNIRKKYDPEFGKALPPEKVNTFFRAEKEWGGFIQRELNERRQNMGPRRLRQLP
jgi:hypothetical protein